MQFDLATWNKPNMSLTITKWEGEGVPYSLTMKDTQPNMTGSYLQWFDSLEECYAYLKVCKLLPA